MNIIIFNTQLGGGIKTTTLKINFLTHHQYLVPINIEQFSVLVLYNKIQISL